MKQDTETSKSSRIIKKRIIAYIIDMEDQRMYPIVDTYMPERNAIELPPIRNPASACHVVDGAGDVAEIEVFADSRPTRIVRIASREQPTDTNCANCK